MNIVTQNKYNKRRKREYIRLKNKDIPHYVETHLKKSWPPEQIAGRLSIDYPHLSTNYESIYQYIYTQRKDLLHYLRKCHNIRKNRRGITRARCPLIPNKVPIALRGDISKEFGHWEVDLVGSSSKATLLAMVERKTKYTILHKIQNKKSETMKYALLFCTRKIDSTLSRSFTYDNGSENALHEEINQRLGTKSYFCEPYHSWDLSIIFDYANTSIPYNFIN